MRSVVIQILKKKERTPWKHSQHTSTYKVHLSIEFESHPMYNSSARSPRPIDDALARASPRRPPAAGLIATPASVVAALTDAAAPRGPPLSTLAAQPAPPGEGDPFAKALRLAAKHLARWQAAATEHTPTTMGMGAEPAHETAPVRLRQGTGSPPTPPASAAVGHPDAQGLLRCVTLLPLLATPGMPMRSPMATVTLVRALLAAAATAACFLAATGPPRREGPPSPSVAALCQLCCRALSALATVLHDAMLSPNNAAVPVLDVLPPSRLMTLLMAISNTAVAAASIAAVPSARAIADYCADGCGRVVYWLVWGAGGGRALHSDLGGAKVVEMVLEAPLVALEDDQVMSSGHKIIVMGTHTAACVSLSMSCRRMNI